MKKTISILLFASIIFSVFATVTNLSSTEPEAPNAATASTTVSLNLSENYATVWFSEETAGTVSIDKYELSLKNPEGLIQSIAGNSSSEKIYAVGNDLYLNWNIVSAADVKIILTMTSPLAQSGVEEDRSKKIGWTVEWKYTGTKDVTPDDKTIALADNAALNASSTDSVYLKNGELYGNAGSKQIKITTDNVWDKNKDRPYTATLTATITTV